MHLVITTVYLNDVAQFLFVFSIFSSFFGGRGGGGGWGGGPDTPFICILFNLFTLGQVPLIFLYIVTRSYLQLCLESIRQRRSSRVYVFRFIFPIVGIISGKGKTNSRFVIPSGFLFVFVRVSPTRH